jgi:hypothetical protein
MLALSLFFISTAAFALGKTDTSVIEPVLAQAKAAGYTCKQDWGKDFYLSQVEAHGTFEVKLNCSNGSNTQTGTIVYQADGSQYARCRDLRALSIELDLN